MKAIITVAAMLAATLAAAQAQNVQTVAQADAALVKVAQDRAVINDEYAASERECSTKFFVNNCLDKAKEKRRVALADARTREVDAQHFKRADSVARRDADLAERARKDADEAELRAAQPPKPAKTEHEEPKPASGVRVVDREAQHDAKVQRQEREDAANAAKRAANVEAFERKKAESVHRQAEVARKKAENDAKAKQAAERAEAEKKKAAAQPPAPAQ
ncbi:hypothetical protein GJ697_06525 [Pseudoduganella sp. FT25W]|uniref:Cell envelope biogenesis protein TolA n=1 Tax=Duganella alba TaxID=2666081 RepID=A0A6L5QCH1_9BURK|nr:hypothetical protein [Duganella alba]MRX07483.1 hypothetical protein [Duganella alba]MRX15868.1 hypothetical protein [Duganella alba]